MHSKKDEEETERRCSFQASCFWSVLHFRLPVAEAAHCRLRLYYALLLNYVVTTSVDPKELLSWSSNAWKSRRCASAWASASASKLWEYPQSATYPTSLRHLCQRGHRWPAPLLQCCQLLHGLMQVHWRMRRWHVLIYTAVTMAIISNNISIVIIMIVYHCYIWRICCYTSKILRWKTNNIHNDHCTLQVESDKEIEKWKLHQKVEIRLKIPMHGTRALNSVELLLHNRNACRHPLRCFQT